MDGLYPILYTGHLILQDLRRASLGGDNASGLDGLVDERGRRSATNQQEYGWAAGLPTAGESAARIVDELAAKTI